MSAFCPLKKLCWAPPVEYISDVAEPAENKRRDYHRSGIYIKAKPGLVLRERRVRRLAERLKAVCPWITDADMNAARAYCEMEILVSQCYAALRNAGVINERGEVRRLFHDYRQMRMAQLMYASALGLTPAARLALRPGHANSLDLPAIFAQSDSSEPDAIDTAAEPENNRRHAED